MLSRLRLLLRDTPILRKTIYRPIFWFMNDVLHFKRCLLQKFGPEALAKVNDVSRRLDIEVYPSFGTLLGIVRDGGLLKHDSDMDFAILPSSTVLNPFFTEIQKEGFIFEWMETVDDCLTEVRFRYYELGVDFFLHSYTGDGKKLLMIQTDSLTRRYEYPLINSLTDYSVLGLSVRVPVNFREYLTSLYGPWDQVVKSGWNSTMAPCFIGYDDVSRYSIATSRSVDDFSQRLKGKPNVARLPDKGYAQRLDLVHH